MKSLKNIVSILALGSFALSVNAQQDPMYTHYMYNTLSINPAYAGSRDALSITALHRSQWVGFKDAPMTQTITIHSPIASKHIGLGLTAVNDKIGPVNNTSVAGQFAYMMQLSRKSKLSLGLSGGINILQADLNSLGLNQGNDPAFQNNLTNRVTPQFGFGAYYSRERFYAGVSTPNLIQNQYSTVNSVNGTTLVGKSQRHYFFIAGAVFNLTPNVALKPTTLVKVTAGAPIQVDVTASFLIHQRFSLGAMYRTGDAFGILASVNITDQFLLGYAYDWSYGLRSNVYNQGSHELMLRYDFIFKGNKQIHSPRYF
jgi:type IX secretion system PorP/SprF family membrane protein